MAPVVNLLIEDIKGFLIDLYFFLGIKRDTYKHISMILHMLFNKALRPVALIDTALFQLIKVNWKELSFYVSMKIISVRLDGGEVHMK